MSAKMNEASSNFEFERAAEIRDTITKVNRILQTETVVNFMKGNHPIVALEYLDDFRIKLFLIRRNEIMFRQIYKVKHLDIQDMKRKICTSLTRTNQHIGTLEKEEIDEAYIIYRYLNSNDCEYVVIEDEWVGSTESGCLENVLKRILPI